MTDKEQLVRRAEVLSYKAELPLLESGPDNPPLRFMVVHCLFMRMLADMGGQQLAKEINSAITQKMAEISAAVMLPDKPAQAWPQPLSEIAANR